MKKDFRFRQNVFITALAGLFLWTIGTQNSFANPPVSLILKAGYTEQQLSMNAAGGFDYLPNGDAIIINQSITGAPPVISIVDTNGDGVPAAPQQLATLPAGSYGSFIKVSPDATFAVFGVTGSADTISKIDLSNYAVTPVTTVIGNHSLTFWSNTEILVSYNDSFNPSAPNRIGYIDLNDPSQIKILVEINNTPSGPIHLSAGNLYYVKSDWQFPLPPGSSRLLKFTRAQVEDALASGTILNESASVFSLPLDGGYELTTNAFGDLFVTNLNGEIIKIDERNQTTEKFCVTPNVPNDGSFTHVAFYKPNKFFNPYEPSDSTLGALFTDSTFTQFTVVQVNTLEDDPWADSVASFSPGLGGGGNSQLAVGAPSGGGTMIPNNSSIIMLGDRDNPTSASPATVEVKFNNSIRDHAQNLYDLDLIVFSNSFWSGGNAQNRFTEPALIEISQDLNHNDLPDDQWFMINPNILPSNLGPLSPVQYNTMTLTGYAEYSPTLLLGDTDGDNVVNNPNMKPEDFYTVPDKLSILGNPQSYLIDNNSGGGDAADIREAVIQTSPGVPLVDSFGRNRYVYLNRVDFIRLRDVRNNDFYAVVGPVTADIDGFADAREKLRGTTVTVSSVSQLTTALAAAVAGDEISVSPGAYSITSTLNVPPGVSLKGSEGLWTVNDSGDDTILICNGLSAPAIQMVDPTGTFASDQGYEISGLHFQDCPIGIQVDRVYPTIENNFFDTTTQAIQIFNASSQRVMIRYNVLGHNMCLPPLIGVEIRNSKAALVHNTLVNFTSSGVLLNNTTSDLYLRDNIFYNNKKGLIAGASDFVYGHNNVFRNVFNDSRNYVVPNGLLEQNIPRDPKFAYPAAGDYRLSLKSSVRGQGMGGADPGIYDGPNFYPFAVSLGISEKTCR